MLQLVLSLYLEQSRLKTHIRSDHQTRSARPPISPAHVRHPSLQSTNNKVVYFGTQFLESIGVNCPKIRLIVT